MNFDDFRGHIYLIDDDPSICRSLAFTLSSSNYSVQTFDGPRAFLKDSLPISPAVILLDMRMPEMTGTELQSTLGQNGRETPIIFISGESQPTEIIEAMKLGAIDFLLKPFSMESLIKAIENGLNKDRTRVQATGVIEHRLHGHGTGEHAGFGETASQQGGVVMAIQVNIDRLRRQHRCWAVEEDFAQLTADRPACGKQVAISLDVHRAGGGSRGIFVALGVCGGRTRQRQNQCKLPMLHTLG